MQWHARQGLKMDWVRQCLSFGKIGILATLSHLTICWLLINSAQWASYLANLAGACVAYLISFFGNATFTFRTDSTLWKCAMRYFFVSLTSLGMTSLILSFVEANGLSFAVYAILVLGAVPPTTFLLAKLWAFQLKSR